MKIAVVLLLSLLIKLYLADEEDYSFIKKFENGRLVSLAEGECPNLKNDPIVREVIAKRKKRKAMASSSPSALTSDKTTTTKTAAVITGVTNCSELESRYDVNQAGYYLMRKNGNAVYNFCDFNIYEGNCTDLWESGRREAGYYRFRVGESNVSPFIYCMNGGGTIPESGRGGVVSGYPGKRGPVGEKGERGSIGPPGGKGMQGLAGVPGQSCACGEYERKLEELKTELLSVRNFATFEWQRISNGRSYHLFKTKVTYAMAKNNCATLGTQLAAAGMRDPAIRRQIYDAFDLSTPVWIGLDDIIQEGRYMWIDNVAAAPSNTHWLSGQPDNYGGNEDCGAVWSNGQGWNDWNCREQTHYLCETDVI